MSVFILGVNFNLNRRHQSDDFAMTNVINATNSNIHRNPVAVTIKTGLHNPNSIASNIHKFVHDRRYFIKNFFLLYAIYLTLYP